MNCFDCATEFNRTSPAIATCCACGAATCGRHTLMAEVTVEVHSIGNPASIHPSGRRLYCETCAPTGATPTGAMDSSRGEPGPHR